MDENIDVKAPLRKKAAKGDVEAIKALTEALDRDRYIELINNMDDDEFTCKAEPPQL